MITNLVLRLLDMAFAAARWVEELNDELNQSGQFHKLGQKSRPIRPASIQTIRTDTGKNDVGQSG